MSVNNDNNAKKPDDAIWRVQVGALEGGKTLLYPTVLGQGGQASARENLSFSLNPPEPEEETAEYPETYTAS